MFFFLSENVCVEAYPSRTGAQSYSRWLCEQKTLRTTTATGYGNELLSSTYRVYLSAGALDPAPAREAPSAFATKRNRLSDYSPNR